MGRSILVPYVTGVGKWERRMNVREQERTARANLLHGGSEKQVNFISCNNLYADLVDRAASLL